MLTYDLDGRGNLPLYKYLYKCIRTDIDSGRIKAGEKLPSKRRMAANLNVGVVTVANAYSLLEAEGYISAVEKEGYFVQEEVLYASGNEDAYEDFIREEPEPELFADFKANRISMKLFPATVWNRFMRGALSLQDESLLKTVPYNGLYELRAAIAASLLQDRGMRVQPAQIIVGAGTEYLYGRLLQLFGRECVFAVEDPGYKKFSMITESFQNPWKAIPIDENGMRIDLLEESGAEVAHISPANHFPTGINMPISRRIELQNWVRGSASRYIIEDDYDSEFRYSGRLILPLFSSEIRDRVVYINTFSKTMVPSLRISYMILPPELLRRYLETQSFYSCTVSSFEQYALSRFISEDYYGRHLNRMRNYYREHRSIVLEAIRTSQLGSIADIVEHNAGTHFLLNVRTEMSDEEVRAAGIERDIKLSLYSDYCYTERRMPGCCTLVINYAGIDREKVGELMRRFGEIFLPESAAEMAGTGAGG